MAGRSGTDSIMQTKKSNVCKPVEGLVVTVERRLYVTYEYDPDRRLDLLAAHGKIDEDAKSLSKHLTLDFLDVFETTPEGAELLPKLDSDIDALVVEYRTHGEDPEEKNRMLYALSDEEPKTGDLVMFSTRRGGFSFMIGRLLAWSGNLVLIRMFSGITVREDLCEGNALRKIRYFCQE